MCTFGVDRHVNKDGQLLVPVSSWSVRSSLYTVHMRHQSVRYVCMGNQQSRECSQPYITEPVNFAYVLKNVHKSNATTM